MLHRQVIACTVIALGTAGTALADPVGITTKCSEVQAIMDATPPDPARVRELWSFVAGTLKTIDHTYGRAGQSEIIERMSVSGFTSMVAMVTVGCLKTPGQTAFETSFVVYDIMRGSQAEAGTLGKPKK